MANVMKPMVGKQSNGKSSICKAMEKPNVKKKQRLVRQTLGKCKDIQLWDPSKWRILLRIALFIR